MENQKLLLIYVSYLRYLSLLYQNAHWQTSGPNFYGNHLLFERLYNGTAKDLDAIAEKTIGLCGSNCINIDLQMKIMHDLCDKVCQDYGVQPEKLLDTCHNVEKDFLNINKVIYEKLKETNELTLGLDDMLMAQASESEGRLYLLQQVLA